MATTIATMLHRPGKGRASVLKMSLVKFQWKNLITGVVHYQWDIHSAQPVSDLYHIVQTVSRPKMVNTPSSLLAPLVAMRSLVLLNVILTSNSKIISHQSLKRLLVE